MNVDFESTKMDLGHVDKREGCSRLVACTFFTAVTHQSSLTETEDFCKRTP
jgi:hypothetical protein